MMSRGELLALSLGRKMGREWEDPGGVCRWAVRVSDLLPRRKGTSVYLSRNEIMII